MLTSQQARMIVERWRDKFPSADALMSSYDRYEARIAAPARTAEGFERWLAEDADQQYVRAAVMSMLTAAAESQPQDLPALVDDCAMCRGRRLLRRDIPPGHADFGTLVRCPACNGMPTHAAPRPSHAERLVCWTCGQFEDAPAGEPCRNPKWHMPNWSSVDFPQDRGVLGWSSARALVISVHGERGRVEQP